MPLRDSKRSREGAEWLSAGMWYHMDLFYDEREMVLAYTVVSTAAALSGLVGAPLAAGLLNMEGILGFHGWQVLILLLALVADSLKGFLNGSRAPL